MLQILLRAFLIATALGLSFASLSSDVYEDAIKFYKFAGSFDSKKIESGFDSRIEGCDPNGNFSMIVHGWTEGIITPWVEPIVTNLLRHRGGCVFVMDYSKYSNVSNYFELVSNFNGISAVLLKKVQQIGNFDRQFFFCFSFGSRLCIDAGIKLGNQSIARMDLCDPANPGFDNNADPKPAAKAVQCINTSTDKGTNVYNCHINFRMGKCGEWQAASGPNPIASHGLCPYFYNLAFSYNYSSNNYYGCSSNRMIKDPPSNVKMGYLGDFNRTQYSGDIFIGTSRYPPYIIAEDRAIDNQFQSLIEFSTRCQGNCKACAYNSEKFISKLNETISDRGCNSSEKLAFIAHGWRENINTIWVKQLVGNLTEARGGCIIFIDYSYYGNNLNYFQFLSHFSGISRVVTRKLEELENEGFQPDDWFMFGHSAGGRLVIDAAANFGYQKVKEIDACELAGPGFDYKSTTMNPQKAAKNVACIHTSFFAGTSSRTCHQDWMMGMCGMYQPADNIWRYILCSVSKGCDNSQYYSHGLCPNFYNSAFRNDFVDDNTIYKCGSEREPKEKVDGFKMGYMESRKSPEILGDFFAPTAENMPWNVEP